MRESLCDLYSGTVQYLVRYRFTELQILMAGMGEGYRTVPKPDGPNPDGFGPCFSVLIMSKAQMGLILCKLSEELRRYERTMDQSNGSRDQNHSHRKETMGSTAAARRAGSQAASAVTAAMPAVAAMKIIGSKELI